MATVFLVHQVSLNRPVALKVLSPELASEADFVKRLLREARVLARLDHPNILRCYDARAVGGRYVLALELAERGSLERVLRRRGRLPVGDALHVALACCRALQYAHAQGVVHRDINPDNVLINGRGEVKVGDFGLAKAHGDPALTKIGAGVGSPEYVAPEQARGASRPDGRSDQFSLGCALYRMLAGELPFKGESLADLTQAKDEGRFRPCRAVNPEVPERLDAILHKMLAAEPGRRYRDCAAVADRLLKLPLVNPRLSFIRAPRREQPPEQPPP